MGRLKVIIAVLCLIALLVFLQTSFAGEGLDPLEPDAERPSSRALEDSSSLSEDPQKGDAISLAPDQFLVVDHEGNPLAGMTVAWHDQPDYLRAFSQDPSKTIGQTDAQGVLHANLGERRALPDKFYAYRADMGARRFMREEDQLVARYPETHEQIIECITLGGQTVSEVTITISPRELTRSVRELAAADSALISIVADLSKKVYVGKTDSAGIIRMRVPEGRYESFIDAPYLRFHSGLWNRGIPAASKKYVAKFDSISAAILRWPKDAVQLVEMETFAWLPDIPLRDHNFIRETERLGEKYDSFEAFFRRGKRPLTDADYHPQVRLYWKDLGWHSHEIGIYRLAPDLEVPELRAPTKHLAWNKPEDASLVVRLLDEHDNPIPLEELSAHFRNDANLPEEKRSPEALSRPPAVPLVSGQVNRLRPGSYTLYCGDRFSPVELNLKKILLAEGEHQELEFKIPRSFRPCQIESEGFGDTPYFSVGFGRVTGSHMSSFGRSQEPVKKVMIPPGEVLMSVQLYGGLVVYRETITVEYDPQYSVQRIPIPREVFSKW